MKLSLHNPPSRCGFSGREIPFRCGLFPAESLRFEGWLPAATSPAVCPATDNDRSVFGEIFPVRIVRAVDLLLIMILLAAHSSDRFSMHD